MNMDVKRAQRRRAVAAIIGSVIMFAMLFTTGVAYFLFINTSAQTTNQANATQQALLQQASAEKLTVLAPPALAVSSATAGELWLRVINTGSVTATVVAVFVTNTLGQLVSTSTLAAHPHYLTTIPDLNISLPLSLSVGASTQTAYGCGAAVGCDIGISKTAYMYAAGTAVLISVLTSSGNVFSAQYPPTRTSVTTSTTITSITSTTNTVFSGGVGANALVVQMTATPPQVLSGSTLTDNVTIYNYATTAITGVTLNPAPPAATVTGTASLTGGSCAGPYFSSSHSSDTADSIAAYSGSGTAPSVYYTCTYTTHTGTVGGFASFSGYAQGSLGTTLISSSQSVSNTVQIGGSVAAINQGPFTANFFLFSYSSCTNAPKQNNPYAYTTPCTTNPATMPPSSVNNLPTADLVSGGSNFYVAYYVQVTNNFNTTLPILENTYFQSDPGKGGESDWFLVGPATNPQTTYYPNYASGTNGLPTLTAYTGSAAACAESAPSYSPPSPTTCIDVAPGQTVTLTFAACTAGDTDWDWGGSTASGSQDATRFDPGASCGNQGTPNFYPPQSAYLSIIISFIYKGQVYAQDLPFEGDTIIP